MSQEVDWRSIRVKVQISTVAVHPSLSEYGKQVIIRDVRDFWSTVGDIVDLEALYDLIGDEVGEVLNDKLEIQIPVDINKIKVDLCLGGDEQSYEMETEEVQQLRKKIWSDDAMERFKSCKPDDAARDVWPCLSVVLDPEAVYSGFQKLGWDCTSFIVPRYR